jgi:hypothetical protein
MRPDGDVDRCSGGATFKTTPRFNVASFAAGGETRSRADGAVIKSVSPFVDLFIMRRQPALAP